MCSTCDLYYEDQPAFWLLMDAKGYTKNELAEDEDCPEMLSCPTCSAYL